MWECQGMLISLSLKFMVCILNRKLNKTLRERYSGTSENFTLNSDVMECLTWDLFLVHVYDSVGSSATVG